MKIRCALCELYLGEAPVAPNGVDTHYNYRVICPLCIELRGHIKFHAKGRSIPHAEKCEFTNQHARSEHPYWHHEVGDKYYKETLPLIQDMNKFGINFLPPIETKP